ncbi:hypothetical protein BKA64DRAFT_235910 [Cadophora sp. MPI-SDFR-AT-0126]|nr:hypothetical protein BKA64DRAFT_235910 [Leotiomycetes sp. MPI-SDFR-AT-0126]
MQPLPSTNQTHRDHILNCTLAQLTLHHALGLHHLISSKERSYLHDIPRSNMDTDGSGGPSRHLPTLPKPPALESYDVYAAWINPRPPPSRPPDLKVGRSNTMTDWTKQSNSHTISKHFALSHSLYCFRARSKISRLNRCWARKLWTNRSYDAGEQAHHLQQEANWTRNTRRGPDDVSLGMQTQSHPGKKIQMGFNAKHEETFGHNPGCGLRIIRPSRWTNETCLDEHHFAELYIR